MPGTSSRWGQQHRCEQWHWHQQWVQVGPAPAASASTGWDCSIQEQIIFNNHQRLIPMIATGTLPWSGIPAHLLHHPAVVNAHHVPSSATAADTHHVPHAPFPGGQHTSQRPVQLFCHLVNLHIRNIYIVVCLFFFINEGMRTLHFHILSCCF
uniref:Uncharacterized protein n=1 Tax=Pipistrellus kuhlii TaxID=59472 RepID=A0A7J7Y9K5_PIPKU|nr:hypothetical protein mPipKuh1_010346 [Pipistrellus kuhlii]